MQAVFEHWRNKLQRPKAQLDTKRCAVIRTALKSRPVEELKTAIDGCAASDYHCGRDPKTFGKRYDDLSLILRDAEHIERFIELAAPAVTAKRANGGLTWEQVMG